jgi:hypothetical protein
MSTLDADKLERVCRDLSAPEVPSTAAALTFAKFATPALGSHLGTTLDLTVTSRSPALGIDLDAPSWGGSDRGGHASPVTRERRADLAAMAE